MVLNLTVREMRVSSASLYVFAFFISCLKSKVCLRFGATRLIW